MVCFLFALSSLVLKTLVSCFLNSFLISVNHWPHLCSLSKIYNHSKGKFYSILYFKKWCGGRKKREPASLKSKIFLYLKKHRLDLVTGKGSLGNKPFWWQIYFIVKVCAFCQNDACNFLDCFFSPICYFLHPFFAVMDVD